MWFANYDQVKLSVIHPEWITLGGVLLFVLLSWPNRKQDTNSMGTLRRVNAEMVKGMAMLAIVIHHLFVHVIEGYAGRSIFFDIGFVAVGVFLFLSGYGLTLSAESKGIKGYWKKRFIKVYLPFVFFNLVWIGMDALIWGKFYSWDWMLRYISGWVLFDRNYWFVQFLLINYLMFWIIYRFALEKVWWGRNLVAGVFIFLVMNSDWVPVAKINILSFWLGMEVAYLGGFKKLNDVISRTGSWIRWVLVTAGVSSIYGLIAVRRLLEFSDTWDYYATMSGLTALTALFVVLAIRYGYYHYYSRAWLFLGTVSFELFLLHGALMYSYDVMLWRGPVEFTFWIYLGALVGLSWLLMKFMAWWSGLWR